MKKLLLITTALFSLSSFAQVVNHTCKAQLRQMNQDRNAVLASSSRYSAQGETYICRAGNLVDDQTNQVGEVIGVGDTLRDAQVSMYAQMIVIFYDAGRHGNNLPNLSPIMRQVQSHPERYCKRATLSEI